MQALKDQIWITAHVRMISEAKFRVYDQTSNLIIFWMSTLLIITSIFSKEIQIKVQNVDKLNIVVSLIILLASVISWGMRHGERGALFRECYLKLEDLHRQFPANAGALYGEILSKYPNHSDGDYEAFLFEKTVIGKNNISVGGNKITCTFLMAFRHIARKVIFFLFFYGVPLYLTWLFLSPILY